MNESQSELKTFPLSLLSISQYGGGMADKGAQFSGASARQQDYATYIDTYHIIVPVSHQDTSPVSLGKNVVVYPVRAKNMWQFFWKAQKKAIELHAQHKYDGLLADNPHISGLLGLRLRKKLQIPLLVHSMADSLQNKWYQAERLSNRIKHILMEYVANRTDYIRVSTEAELQRLSSARYAKKLLKLPFYVDHEAILKASTAEVARDPNTILFVGRLGLQKDLPKLLQAMKMVVEEVPEAKLVLVGGGPLRDELEVLAEKLNISHAVTFTGPIPYEIVIEYFEKASIFAITSLYEGTCMVLHEAALLEVPIVATEFAGAKDIIRTGETGQLVPIRQPEKFAVAIISYLKHPEQARKAAINLATEIKLHDRHAALRAWQAVCVQFLSHKN